MGGTVDTRHPDESLEGAMEAEVKGYLVELGILREQIKSATRGLTEEAGNWRPLADDSNSIYAIICHLIGSDSFWVKQVIGRGTVDGNRAAEFRAAGSLSEALSRWEKDTSMNQQVLGKLTSSQLGESRDVSSLADRGPIDVRWCILHLISHYALHLGHIQLTRQLWEQRR